MNTINACFDMSTEGVYSNLCLRSVEGDNFDNIIKRWPETSKKYGRELLTFESEAIAEYVHKNLPIAK